MTAILVRKGEPLEKALKRFKKKCDKEGTMRTLRDKQFYEKPSDRNRKKNNAARSKALRNQNLNR